MENRSGVKIVSYTKIMHYKSKVYEIMAEKENNMRIDILELQCDDIMWFGVDRKNHIFECTSGGVGNVPEFVCKSKEEMLILEDFFMNILKESTVENLLCDYEYTNQLVQDCIHLARKGVFCYDIADNEEHKFTYEKITEPVNPLSYYDLPDAIQEIMRDHKILSIDVERDDYIEVEHAY